MRKGPYWARLSGFAGVLALLAYLGIGAYYAESLTRVHRQPLESPASAIAPAHEDVAFPATDGLTLRGWWFPPTDGTRDRSVVLVHGKDGNRATSTFTSRGSARFLLAHGYGVLLFDLRGHGESDGLRWGLGQFEGHDIVGAVRFAAAKAGIPERRVAVIGESMGGGSALMAVAEDPGVGPVVTDSAYASALQVIDEVGPLFSGLPPAFTPGIAVMARLRYGLDLTDVVPANVVRAHPERAFLFIQCEDDHTVWRHHGVDLRNASRNERSELWLVPGCDHVEAVATHPEEWQARVLAFLEREMR